MAAADLNLEATARELGDLASERLRTQHEALTKRYPGESEERQPVHTVYGGAHLFKHNSSGKLGELALRSMVTFAPDAASFAQAVELGISGELAERIYTRVREKLAHEPIEDFRIDFEDGYGVRPDADEDEVARTAAREVALGLKQGTLPPFIGIRIKPLNQEFQVRALRTLEFFLMTLLEETGGELPPGFAVTLPKIITPEQVATLVEAFESIEARSALGTGRLKLELMVETTQSILGADGRCPLLSMVEAAGGRCRGAHFGVYDYTASCSITAAYQHMRHPACDFARHVMQVALSGTGVMLSDGATNIMPAPPHRAAPGQPLTVEQDAENRQVVHRAWRIYMADVRHSLQHAYYQGWDLHPAQLPTRYAALYSFFLGGLDAASDRLRNFIEKAAQATLSGDVFDDAATGQGLLNFFLRGLNCGAITEDEALQTGLSLEELRLRSFARILKALRQRA